VDDIEIEVVSSPVRELFLADWFNLWSVVERAPEFGDKKEVLAFN
jgi:hypothetical protein